MKLINKIVYIFFVTGFLTVFGSNKFGNVDLICFSYNRPMQLYAFLESVEKYTSCLNNIYVIYRSENEGYNKAYEEVIESFKNVFFIKQGNFPKKDFKPLLLKCFNSKDSEFIVFGVDDIIVKDYFNFNDCISAINETDSYGFYLRLGENIVKTSHGKIFKFKLPDINYISKNIFRFRFDNKQPYWNYPNTLDMTVYKKYRIDKFLHEKEYFSPNTLESVWASSKDFDYYGLCYEFSKVVNTPFNIVQQDFRNPHNNTFAAQDLLLRWNNGYKIDIDCFHKINNLSPHLNDIKPIFKKR